MKTIIFDLDGTLANINHRLHHVKNGNRQWDKFFIACPHDEPIQPVIDLCIVLKKQQVFSEVKIIIVSGRSDIVRKETEEWLEKHFIEYDELIMRPAGDYTPDHILKEQILDKLLAEGHEILFTVDDRQRVVDMWRRRGITCLQAAAWEETDIEKKPSKGILTLMVGPSGSGKSTFLEQWCENPSNTLAIHSSHIVSSDQIRADLCGDFRDQKRNAEVFSALHKIVQARINSGLPCVVDATNIKRADRMKLVEMAEGSAVRYIVIDRPLEEKYKDAGWRAEVPFDLILKHHQTFQSNLKDILKGDNQANVEVIDLRKM